MVRIKDNCIGCGLCVDDCITRSIFMVEDKAEVRQPCLECGHCFAICPVGAPEMTDVDMSDVEELDSANYVDIASLLHTIKGRRSVRQYQKRPIEREKLEKMFQAGRYTATAVNYQDLRFIVVQEKLEEFKKLIWDGLFEMQKDPEKYQDIEGYWGHLARKAKDPTDDYLFRNAPAIIFVVTDRLVDAGMAAQNMELAAVSQGLGVMYNGYMVRAANMVPGAAKWLGLGDRKAAACMLAGYPDVTYLKTAPRKPADILWK